MQVGQAIDFSYREEIAVIDILDLDVWAWWDDSQASLRTQRIVHPNCKFVAIHLVLVVQADEDSAVPGAEEVGWRTAVGLQTVALQTADNSSKLWGLR